MKVQEDSKAKKEKEKKENIPSSLSRMMFGPEAVHAFLWLSMAAPIWGQRIYPSHGPKCRTMQRFPSLAPFKKGRYLYKERRRFILACF
jgi:hypothetical protein